jgi:hypothetical protein
MASVASARATIDRTFAALADPSRRRVIELLRNEPKRAGDIASGLRLLHRTGLVEAMTVDEDARLRVFRLRPEPFVELRGWLREVEAFWAGQLAAFKAHTERTRGSGTRPRKRRRRE